jgi:hypothetical protein
LSREWNELDFQENNSIPLIEFKDYLENRYHLFMKQINKKEDRIPWKRELEFYLDNLEGRSLKEKKIHFHEFSSFLKNINI